MNGKLKGTIYNNGDRKIYPIEIIYFVKNPSNSNTFQKIYSYVGCFNDDWVINSKEKFEFEIEEEWPLDEEKGIVIVYSDLSFKEYETKIFK